MKKWIWPAILCVIIVCVVWYKSNSHIVPGAQQVYCGTLVDRGMHPVELKDIYMPWDRNRAYLGIEFQGGGGDCYWLADGYSCPEDIEIGDTIRVEIATERWTGFQVITHAEEVNHD